jgi:hypothetical protein
MNDKLKAEVHKWLKDWGTRRKISAKRLKEFGYNIDEKYLEIDARKEDKKISYRIYQVLCEHSGREAKFCFLQQDEDSVNGEILDIKFKDFEKLS